MLLIFFVVHNNTLRHGCQCPISVWKWKRYSATPIQRQQMGVAVSWRWMNSWIESSDQQSTIARRERCELGDARSQSLLPFLFPLLKPLIGIRGLRLKLSKTSSLKRILGLFAPVKTFSYAAYSHFLSASWSRSSMSLKTTVVLVAYCPICVQEEGCAIS